MNQMSTDDKKMYDKGYRYRLDPTDGSASPYISMYAKTTVMVSIILKDWPKQKFGVVQLEETTNTEGGKC